jgi:hypothetical protein
MKKRCLRTEGISLKFQLLVQISSFSSSSVISESAAKKTAAAMTHKLKAVHFLISGTSLVDLIG